MRQSGLVVPEGASDEGAPAAEAEQADIEEGDADEEEIDYNTTMPSKPSHLDFGKSTVSTADMPMMTKLGYFGEAEKKLIRFGGEEITPKPENDEVVVFRSFFKAGLRFSLKFEYPDYERLSKGAEGPKRKSAISVMQRQAAKMIKEDENLAKKKKFSPKPKVAVSKKRKAIAPKPKAHLEEEIPSTPSAADAEEILKVMTESLPNKLSPLGLEMMKLLQKKKEPSAAEKPVEPKMRRIITVIEAIEETPSSASAPKTAAVKAVPAESSTSEAAAAEATNLENTLSVIDEMILNMAEEETAAATEEILAAVPEKREKMPGKEKELAEDASEEKNFNFQNIIGQELSKAEKGELRDYAISAGGAALRWCCRREFRMPSGPSWGRRLSALYKRVLAFRSLRLTSADTGDNILPTACFILTLR
jgi:hypothetical protein